MHIFHAVFTPSLGGLEQAFVNITRAYALSGHTVTAVLRPDAPYLPEVAEITENRLLVKPAGFYDIRAVWRLRRALKKARPDMVLAHAPRAIALMSYAAWGLGIPVCGMLHSYRASRIRHADRLVVLSEDMRRFVMEAGYPGERISTITNMIQIGDTPRFKATGSPLIIGGMGRFAPEKGFTDLLEATAILLKRGVDVRLILAGGGKKEAVLKAKALALGISERVEFMGWVKDKEAFFSRIQVFCLPSREESFGIVLLEAMVRGIAVVCTDTPGPLSMLTHDVNALFVPIGAPLAIADAMQRLHDTHGLAEALAAQAWQRVQDFSKPNVTAKWNAIAELTVSESARAAKRSA